MKVFVFLVSAVIFASRLWGQHSAVHGGSSGEWGHGGGGHGGRDVAESGGAEGARGAGRVVEYDLTVSEREVEVGGERGRALTLNGGIPGPVLRFVEGDWARIRLHNGLRDEETSLHWHGLLVPNREDGVPHLTTPPVGPGGSHTFEFPLRQSGTYWYHSHTGLQEQKAVYGAIVVEPREERKRAEREEVVVLSEWTREKPEEVLRTLKRGSAWYGIKKGSAQSLAGALRAGALGDYLRREASRMPPMDYSDVAYDAFLINGQPEVVSKVPPGRLVRLRIINASAATYFYVEHAAGPMRIVASDGMEVQPVEVQRLLIGIAETYDVVVRIPEAGRWEFRATAQDGSGKASLLHGSGELHPAPAMPKPEIYRMDDMLMAGLEEDEAEAVHGGHSGAMRKGAGAMKERPLSPYRLLRSVKPTRLSEGASRRVMELHLTGDMQRYLWSFNGKTMDEESVIAVRRGEVLRLELVNDTMMHHPIHLHGHFFRLLNGQGDFAPLKHTVDVPPMSRRVIEFEANEEGDWMFHCHVLYHMMEGMGRVFTYRTPGPDGKFPGLHLGEHSHAMTYGFLDGMILSNRSEGTARMMWGRNDVLLNWEAGWRGGDWGGGRREAELLYERYGGPNFGVFAGGRGLWEEGSRGAGVLGGWYRLPFLVMGRASIDSRAAARFELGKTFALDTRLNLLTSCRYDTDDGWEGRADLDYRVTKAWSVRVGYHSSYGFGAGLGFQF